MGGSIGAMFSLLHRR
jgi:hypothetical protein